MTTRQCRVRRRRMAAEDGIAAEQPVPERNRTASPSSTAGFVRPQPLDQRLADLLIEARERPSGSRGPGLPARPASKRGRPRGGVRAARTRSSPTAATSASTPWRSGCSAPRRIAYRRHQVRQRLASRRGAHQRAALADLSHGISRLDRRQPLDAIGHDVGAVDVAQALRHARTRCCSGPTATEASDDFCARVLLPSSPTTDDSVLRARPIRVHRYRRRALRARRRRSTTRATSTLKSTTPTTHGYTEINFAACAEMVGMRFCPRIRSPPPPVRI